MIASSVSISLNDTIHANGGNGGSRAGDGGGGSGGAIRLVAPTITGTGTLSTLGGVGRIDSGGPGRIRVEALQNTFTGAVNGDARIVTLVPNPILLPTASLGTLRIVSVGGQAVPGNPQGNFNPVDVTLNTAQPVDIVLEGKNIPPGTPVTVTIVNETEGSQIVTSLPLAGTAALSTASATATIPAGFSRLFTHATWSQ